MRIVYVSPIFEVSSDPGSDRYYYFCKHLRQKGHEVIVITSAVIYKYGKLRPETEGHWRMIVDIEGIKVHYLWSYPNFRGSFLRRMVYLLSFMILALVNGLFIKRPDVIYAPNSPGLIGFVGYLLSVFRNVPLVFEVADVWPDAGIAMGLLKNRTLIWLTRISEAACYRRAKRIVVLTRGIKANLQSKGVSVEKVLLIPNGVDPAMFDNSYITTHSDIRLDLGLKDKFICLYMGAHGHYNSLWTIIEAANCLKNVTDVVFVLIGDGDYKARLQEMARKFELSNVVFVDPVPRSDSPRYLAIADVFLLPNRRGDFFHMNLPNKLFDYLITGRPIIVAGEGETAQLVKEAEAGMVVPAEDSSAMGAAIVNLRTISQADRTKMGKSGRAFVIKHYNRATQSQQIEQTLLFSTARN